MNTALNKQEQTSINRTQAPRTRRPHYQVQEKEDVYLVEVTLPGVRRENLSLTLEKGELDLLGKREQSTPEGWKALHRESVDADYRLRLSLNVEVDEQKINAMLEDGILILTLPKAEAAKPRKITIS